MTYTIAVCTVKSPDDGQRNCPKHVEFYSKNKFEKLVHLVGFVIRIIICTLTALHYFVSGGGVPFEKLLLFLSLTSASYSFRCRSDFLVINQLNAQIIVL